MSSPSGLRPLFPPARSRRAAGARGTGPGDVGGAGRKCTPEGWSDAYELSVAPETIFPTRTKPEAGGRARSGRAASGGQVQQVVEHVLAAGAQAVVLVLAGHPGAD